MSLFSALGIEALKSVVEVVGEAWDSDNRKEIAIAESNNQKKIENTKTIVGGAVIATGIAGLAYIAGKAVENSTSTKINTPFGSIETSKETSETPLLGNRQDSITVDYDTVWIDRAKNEFGANIINNKSGVIEKIIYQIKSIGDKAYRIYESKNGEKWLETGIVDWNKMSIYDLGRPENGGPIFAEVAKSALRLTQK